MEEKRSYEGRRRLTMGLAFASLILTLAAMLYTAFTRTELGPQYAVCVIAGIAAFWIFSDIVTPIAAHEFDTKTKAQVTAYKAVVACDFVGYAGLIFFCLTLEQQKGFYGVVVYAVSTMIKRRFLEDYKKSPEECAEEEMEAEAEETSSQIEAAADAAPGKRSLHDLAAMAAADEEQPEEPSEEQSVSKQTGE